MKIKEEDSGTTKGIMIVRMTIMVNAMSIDNRGLNVITGKGIKIRKLDITEKEDLKEKEVTIEKVVTIEKEE